MSDSKIYLNDPEYFDWLVSVPSNADLFIKVKQFVVDNTDIEALQLKLKDDVSLDHALFVSSMALLEKLIFEPCEIMHRFITQTVKVIEYLKAFFFLKCAGPTRIFAHDQISTMLMDPLRFDQHLGQVKIIKGELELLKPELQPAQTPRCNKGALDWWNYFAEVSKVDAFINSFLAVRAHYKANDQHVDAQHVDEFFHKHGASIMDRLTAEFLKLQLVHANSKKIDTAKMRGSASDETRTLLDVLDIEVEQYNKLIAWLKTDNNSTGKAFVFEKKGRDEWTTIPGSIKNICGFAYALGEKQLYKNPRPSAPALAKIFKNTFLVTMASKNLQPQSLELLDSKYIEHFQKYLNAL